MCNSTHLYNSPQFKTKAYYSRNNKQESPIPFCRQRNKRDNNKPNQIRQTDKQLDDGNIHSAGVKIVYSQLTEKQRHKRVAHSADLPDRRAIRRPALTKTVVSKVRVVQNVKHVYTGI